MMKKSVFNLCVTSLAVRWLRLRLPMQEVCGSVPGKGAKDSTCLRAQNQNIKKQKQYCNKVNKDVKKRSTF